MIQSLVAALFYMIQNTCSKLFSRSFRTGVYPLCMFIALGLAIGCGGFLAIHRPAVIPSETMLYAAVFGVLFVVTLSMIVVTMQKGPMGLSALIIDMNVAFTSIFAAVVWKEPLTVCQRVSIAVLLMVIAAFSLPERGEKDTTPIRLNWLMTAILTSLLNGTLDLVQAAAFKVCPSLSAADFTFWSLLMGIPAGLFAGLLLKVLKGARIEAGDQPPARQPPLTCKRNILRALAPLSAGMGLSTVLAYLFHNDALAMLPSAVVFPVVIGLTDTLLMLVSAVALREKLSPRKYLLFAAGLVGVIMMNF